jgi:hypothetical protein
MKFKLTFTLSLLAFLYAFTVNAQDTITNDNLKKNKIHVNLGKKTIPIGKPYFGNSLDGVLASTAFIDRGGNSSLGTLRLAGFFHIGFTYNYNFNKTLGVYTGLDLKNLGLIEKFTNLNTTLKQRVYALGIPVGLRIGDLKHRNYWFLGAGIDLAIHYKYKLWNDQLPKIKSSGWFSNQSELLLPYIFTGFAIKGNTFKIQYYPTNFISPNAGYHKLYAPANISTKANLLLFSVGRDMNYSKKKKK